MPPFFPSHVQAFASKPGLVIDPPVNAVFARPPTGVQSPRPRVRFGCLWPALPAVDYGLLFPPVQSSYQFSDLSPSGLHSLLKEEDLRLRCPQQRDCPVRSNLLPVVGLRVNMVGLCCRPGWDPFFVLRPSIRIQWSGALQAVAPPPLLLSL